MKWIYPCSPTYNQERKNWDTRFNVYPDSIVKNYTIQDVKQALTYIIQTKQQFAIRAGRHCFEPWSLTSGIVLDVGNINHVKIKKNYAKIGAGALLGNIYKELLNHDYFIPAGTRPTVGIGGQGVNGGIGYATRKCGLLIDSIIKMKVLLANGKVVTISLYKHPKLFWALRGAGAGNFGIVLEYTIKLYEAVNVTVFKYTYVNLEDQIYVLHWLTQIKNDTNLTCQAVISKDSVDLTGQLFGTPDQLHLNLPPPNTKEVKYVTYKEAVEYFSAPTVPESVKAKSRFFDKPMNTTTIKSLIDFVKNTLVHEGTRLTIGFQQLLGKSEGSIPWHNATYWLNWSLRWNKGCNKVDLSLMEDSYLNTIKDSAATKYSYMGMMDINAYKWYNAYYGNKKNIKKLLKIKRKYDPCNFFRYPQSLISTC